MQHSRTHLIALLSIAVVSGCALGVTPLTADDGGATSAGDGGKSDAGAGDAAKKATVDAGDTDAEPAAPADTDAGVVDDDAGPAPCPGYALPNDTAACHACGSTSTQTCQPNGCYGGYYCDLSTSKCSKKPAGC
ncbi:MAG: hypothetical protein U0235_10490 [Polyangiaceae bacterium]